MGAAKVEIAFYSQDEASVFLESTAPTGERGRDELSLFVYYVLRQFANLGQGDQSGFMLAQALSKVGYEPGQDSIREMMDTVRVVPSRGRGRKGFEATF
jgi:hypothetical protein